MMETLPAPSPRSWFPLSPRLPRGRRKGWGMTPPWFNQIGKLMAIPSVLSSSTDRKGKYMKDHIKDMKIKPKAKSSALICLHSIYKRLMKATTEPLFPLLNRWLQSLRCTMFHSTWTGSLLHHNSGLQTPEPQFCPPSILPWQLLLSSDMYPLDHPARQNFGLERRAKWMASRWTDERMAMHIIHSDVWCDIHNPGQKMPQTVKPLRISNHVKCISTHHCTQIHHIKPLRLW